MPIFPPIVWGAVCVKVQLHDFNNVSRCAVSYLYFQYQDAYSVILVFINTSVKVRSVILVFINTSVRMPKVSYWYLFQDAYSVILVFINTSVRMPIVSYWYL